MKRLTSVAIAFLLMLGLAACESPEEKAADYMREAERLFQQGDNDKSRVQLRNALKLDPRLAAAHYLNFRIAEKARDGKSMFNSLSAVLDIDPNHLDAQLAIGRLYVVAGRLDDAQAAVDHARELAPEDYRVHVLQGAIFGRLERQADALAEAKTAYGMAADDTDVVVLYAVLLVQAGDHATALQVLDKALLAHDDQDQLHMLRFNTLAAANRRDEAIATLQKLIDRRPTDLVYRRALALYHTRNGDAALAEKALRDAVAANPDNVDAKLLLAGLLSQSDEAAAIAALKSFVDEDKSGTSKLAFALGDLYVRHGELDAASQVYAGVIASSEVLADDLEAKNNLVRVALRQSKRPEAGRLIEEILAGDPKNADALLSRALLELDQRDTEKAIADLRLVLRDKPQSDRAMVLLAQAYLQNNATELAEQSLFNALEVNPLNRTGALQYARLKMRRGELEKAEQVLTRLVQGGVQDQEVNGLRVQVQLARRDWDGARELASTIADNSNNPAFELYVDALTQQSQKRYPEAIALYGKALEIEPKMTGALAAIAQCHRENGEPAKGIAFIRQFIAAHPDDREAMLVLADEFVRDNKIEQARAQMREVLKVKADSRRAFLGLAATYLRQNPPDLESAAGIYAEAVAAMPQSIEMKYELALTREKQGRLDVASKLYREILEVAPGTDVAANNLAVIVAGDGSDPARLAEAIKLAARFENSEQPWFADTLGWIHYQHKNFGKAAELVGRAVKNAPEVGIFRYHYGAALYELKDFGGARQQLEQAERIGREKGSFEGYEQALELLAKVPQV